MFFVNWFPPRSRSGWRPVAAAGFLANFVIPLTLLTKLLLSMSTDYNSCYKQLLEQSNQITTERASWMQKILFLSATLFGILVSLHTNTPTNLCTRWCFVAACVLLALGTLLLSIASYSHIAARTQVRNMYAEEVQNAIAEHRPVQTVRANKSFFFSICEKSAYICLLGAMLLLALYSVFTIL